MKKVLLIACSIVIALTAVYAQNVGIGTDDPKNKLDVNGGLSLREGPVLNLSNGGASGGANDNIALPNVSGGGNIKASFYRIAGPTAAFSVFGIVPYSNSDGQMLTLVNTTAQVMTIKDNASSTAANSFKTLKGGDLVSIAGGASITIQYNKTDLAWYVTGHQNFVPNGAVTGVAASNGLTATPSGQAVDVKLGGTLNAPTTVAMGGNNLMFTGTGNIGIGTNSPIYPLHIQLPDAVSLNAVKFEGLRSAAGGHAVRLELWAPNSPATADKKNFNIINTNPLSGVDANSIEITAVTDAGNTATSIMSLTHGGNVGLGIYNPPVRLNVLGSGASGHRGMMVQNTVADITNKGAMAIIGARRTNAHAPFSVLGNWDEGTLRQVYIGGTGWGMPDANMIRFFTAPVYDENINTGVERIRIMPDGKVGIGTTTPLGTLHVYNPNAYNGNENDDNVNSIVLHGSVTSASGSHFGGITWASGGRKRAGISSVMEDADADHVGLAFWTQGIDGPGAMFESMRIARNGNVGIGTIAPNNFKLQVAGDAGPEADVTYNLGSPSRRWNNIYVNSIQGPGALWARNGTTIHNSTLTDNVAIGTNTPAANAKLDVTGGDINGNKYLRLRAWDDDATNYGTGSGGIWYRGTGGASAITPNSFIVNTSNWIVQNNNLGVATLTPSAKIHIGGANNALRLDYDNTDSYYGSLRFMALQLGNNGSNRIVAGRTTAGGYLDFWVNNTNDASDYNVAPDGTFAMRINSSGFVGMGLASPQKRLDVLSAANDFVTIAATALGVGQYTGIHFGYREDNTLYRKSAIVFERTDNAGGGGNTAGKIHFLNGPEVGNGSATLSDAKVTIGETGNLGVGNIAPSAKLHVTVPIGSSTTGLQINTPNSSPWGIIMKNNTAPGNGLQIFQGDGGQVYFYNDYSTFNTPMITLLQGGSGYVGIGTPSPIATLDVVNPISTGRLRVSGTQTGYTQADILLQTATEAAYTPGARGLGVYMQNQGNNTTWYMGNPYATSDEFVINRKGGSGFLAEAASRIEASVSNFMTVTNTGVIRFPGVYNNTSSLTNWVVVGPDGTLYRTSSSIKYKKEIENYNPDVSLIGKLRPVTFLDNEKTATPNNRGWGLIAEEVDKLYPEMVIRNEKGEIEGVKYGLLPVLMIKAAQTQEEKITKLEQQVETLMKEMQQLKGNGR